MLQFIPFDDRWFDAGEVPPGPLVPYHVGVPCARSAYADAETHCVVDGTLMKVATSPSRTPNLAAVPAFSSST